MASDNDPLGRTLLEACGAAGYRAETIDDQEIGGILRARNRSAPATERVLTIWDIPVLEPGWADRLERRAIQTGPVIAARGVRRSRDRRSRQGRRGRRLPRTPLRYGRLDRRGRSRGPIDRPGIVACATSGRAGPRVTARFSSSCRVAVEFGDFRRHGQIVDRCLESPDGHRRLAEHQQRVKDASRFDEVRSRFAGRWAQGPDAADPARAGLSRGPRRAEERPQRDDRRRLGLGRPAGGGGAGAACTRRRS